MAPCSWRRCLWAAPVSAEKADRTKPMVVEADRPGTVDLQHQVVVFNGNVVISQGTMVLRAERVEMREMPDGYRAASAIGSRGKPATWRQRATASTRPSKAPPTASNSTAAPTRCASSATVRCGACAGARWPTRSPVP